MTVTFTTANGEEFVKDMEAEDLEEATEKLEEEYGAGILISNVEM